MRKRIMKALSVILAVVLTFTAVPLSGFVGFDLPEWLDFSIVSNAEETATSGTCGPNLTWIFDDSTGTLTISGTGLMYVYDFYDRPWGFYQDKITTVIINNGVTNISSYAFDECYILTSIIIPDSVKSIGIYAFERCLSLTDVTIPDSVTGIGDRAFDSCESLTDVTIPDSVTRIGYYAFGDCDSLTSVTIGDSVTTIGEGAFCDCDSLTSVTIGDSVTTIGKDAFGYCDSLIELNIKDISTWCSVSFDNGLANPLCYANTLKLNGETVTDLIIPDGIAEIKDCLFLNCDNLTSVTIPDSVTTIGDCTFSDCDSLTSVTIGDSVTTIGNGAFYDCTSLTSVTIGDSVTMIGKDAFKYCTSLTSITIPDSVISIGESAFYYCTSLESVTIGDSVTTIGEGAFCRCDSLTDVYYTGTEEQWNEISIDSCNDCLFNATIHYNSTGEDITDDNESNYKFYLSKELVFLDKNEYFKFNAYLEDGTDITDSLDWKSYDENIADFVSPGMLLAKENGSALILVSTPISGNDYYEFAYCDVYVGDPNHIEYNTIYDEEYYYNGDGFYSNSAQISNAVDIYLSLENVVQYELQDYYNEYITNNKYEEEFSSLEVGEFTVTATVSGNDLSFSENGYSNTYSETFTNIPLQTIVDDMLILYPYNLSVSGDEKSYTVNIKIESDDFETIDDTITFTVLDLASKSANEHIDYLDSNIAYNTSLHNAYGTCMVKLKDDKEYKWSKYSTFDFENYYEVVVGDMLIDILNVYQTGNISLLPTVVTEYNSIINKVVSNINTIVYNDYVDDKVDISKNDIDKFIKISKYREDGIYAENVVFQAIQKTCGTAANADKINKAFEAADKTGQVCKFLNFGLDTINNIIDSANRISVFNAYSEANNSFKEVFEKLYEFVPDSEDQMREALQDYINYADNGFTMTAEFIETYANFSKKVGIDALTTFFGKSFIELTSATVCKWIGAIPIKGGTTFATTALFGTVQAALGGVLTGAAVGLCLTDLCCSSSKKSAEMGKIVAMSEYSPYIIETVKYYENNMRTNKNNYAVELFEHAFALHKVSQVYITEHTIKALETKRDSLIEKLFNREGEYEEIITDTLSEKVQFENMKCHPDNTSSSVVRKTKVIAIKCPVDVFVFDENGNIVVEIRNNTLVYCADGIEVCISDSKKYICVPAENEYEVKIVSTGEGTMDYVVYEYDENAELQSKKGIDNIPLSAEKEFNGTIYETDEYNQHNHIYSLISNNDEYFTQENVCVKEGHVTSVINYKAPSCVNDGYSGDVYCENCQRVIEYGEYIDDIGHNYEEGSCINCGEKESNIPEEPEYNYTLSIQSPSRTEIRNKDGIILHANVEGTAPNGFYVKWESSNGNFDKSADGSNLKIIAKNKGYTTFTAILCDADGNELARDSVEMYSKSGFFDKIGGFFRSLFGTTKIYDN